jgi:hypothetical protein
MHDYRLAGDVYMAQVEDGVVFLNLNAGKYMGISTSQVEALRRHVRDWPATDDRVSAKESRPTPQPFRLISQLVDAGILTCSKATPKAPTPSSIIAARSYSSWHGSPAHVTPRDVMLLVATMVSVALLLRIGKLKFIVSLLQRSSARAREAPDPGALRTHRVLASFFALRPWFYTARENCLFDSLVLRLFLAKSGVSCAFVIGASTRPFRAHAWVQILDCVVNDNAERVLEFTPMLFA